MSASPKLGVDAYDARFAMVRDRLVRVCAGLVGIDDAEDVVQEAFVRGRSKYRQLRE
jgi:DNA-directed RNA polymerase specialized sigma24 family protein